MKKLYYKFVGFLSTIKILKFDYFRIRFRINKRRFKRKLIKRKLVQILLIIVIISLLIIAIIQGYRFPWTGFSGISSKSVGIQNPKTLWDWMELLIIPCLLGFLAYLFTNSQKSRELSVAQINKRDKALQQYFDYMTILLINEDAFTDERIEVTKRIARATTLAVLEILDGKQKGHVLRFLIEAELIQKGNQFINLRRANLEDLELDPGSYNNCNLNGANLDRASLAWCHFCDSDMTGITMQNADLESTDFYNVDLDYALLNNSDLYHANLRKAHLIKVDFQRANLQYADLTDAVIRTANFCNANLQFAKINKAYLRFANLSFANLKNADLSETDLVETNFYGANLRNANLSRADLTGSNIAKSQVHKTKTFENAVLPFELA